MNNNKDKDETINNITRYASQIRSALLMFSLNDDYENFHEHDVSNVLWLLRDRLDDLLREVDDLQGIKSPELIDR